MGNERASDGRRRDRLTGELHEFRLARCDELREGELLAVNRVGNVRALELHIDAHVHAPTAGKCSRAHSES